MPGYSGMRPPASPPNDRRCATACWCGLHGDRPTKLWIKTFDPSNGLQTSVSGGFGVVEIGGYFGACPRWVTDPAAELAPPDHKRDDPARWIVPHAGPARREHKNDPGYTGRFLTQMCARFSPSRSAAPWEEAADMLVPANQR